MVAVSLEEIKSFLNIKENTRDNVLQVISNHVCTAIETYCHRTFEASNHSEIHDGGVSKIYLNNPPINEIFQLQEFNGTNYANVVFANSISSNTQVIFDNVSGELTKDIRHNILFNDYKAAVQIDYNGGYTTVPVDIKMAAIQWIALIEKRSEALKSFSADNHGQTFQSSGGIPTHIKFILDWYRL